MGKYKYEILLGIIFSVISLSFFSMQFLLFKDMNYIEKELMFQLGFLPINVFIVTIVIENLFSRRDKNVTNHKLNMVIGVFFSEMGRQLLNVLIGFDEDFVRTKQVMNINSNFTDKDFLYLRKSIKGYVFHSNSRIGDLDELKKLLALNKDFLLGLIQNQNLLEHETFTELMWSIFHILEELNMRGEVSRYSEEDYVHISVDLNRVYTKLNNEWIYYAKHMKNEYPFLFNLAIKTCQYIS